MCVSNKFGKCSRLFMSATEISGVHLPISGRFVVCFFRGSSSKYVINQRPDNWQLLLTRSNAIV